ncbi:MAG: glycosyltransferase, partial [Bdellovibrionota bacterium]
LRVMTEYLGPSELGRYAIIISVTTFFALVFINPAGMYVNRRLHSWNTSATLKNHLIRYGGYVLGVAVLALVSLPLFQNVAEPAWPLETLWLASLVAGSVFVTTVNQTIIPAMNLLHRRTAWLIFSTLTLWLALGASALLTSREPTAEMWQLGQLVGFGVGAAIAIPFFSKYLNKTTAGKDEAESFKKILTFAAPLALSVGLYWCQFQSYRLIVGRWISLETLGGFMGIYTLVAGLMSAYENLIQQYLYPKLYADSSSADELARAAAWRKYATLAIPMTFIAGLALYSAHGPFIRLFLAPTFHTYAAFALAAVVVETCRVVGSAYGMAGQVAYRTQTLLLPQLLGVILLLLLTPSYFSSSTTEVPHAFLMALGIPAVLYVFASMIVTRVKLDMKFPARTLNPVLVGLFIAWAIQNSSPLFSPDRAGDLLQLLTATIAFGAVALWVIWNWRRYERPAGRELRVVHIMRAPAGGIRLHVLLLMEESPAQQWLVTDFEDEDSVFREKRQDPSFASKLIPLSISENPGFSDIANLVRLYFKLRKLKPDILHGHGAKGGLYARILADSLFAKAVYSAHGGSLHLAFSPLKQRLYNFVEKALALKTDAVVFESDYTRRRYIESISDVATRGHLVPNGLSLSSSFKQEQKPSGRFVIGAFGLLRYMKGHDLLIESIPLLRAKGLDVEARIFGDGPLRGEYETLISRLKLEDHVRLMGDVANPLDRIRECDLIVQPSRFESFGYTAVEAMSVGVPLVAAAIGGLTEIVEDGVDGLLVKDLTPSAFAEKIETALRDPELRQRLVRAARAKVEATYDASRMKRNVFEVYRRTCSV